MSIKNNKKMLALFNYFATMYLHKADSQLTVGKT